MFGKEHQAFDTVFHHQMEHHEVRQKYSAARRIFKSRLSVSFGDETLRLILDISIVLILCDKLAKMISYVWKKKKKTGRFVTK